MYSEVDLKCSVGYCSVHCCSYQTAMMESLFNGKYIHLNFYFFDQIFSSVCNGKLLSNKEFYKFI